MDVLEFAKIQRRMCETYDCTGCPLFNKTCRIAMGSAENDEEIVSIVGKWAKEHPLETRQSEFLKLFPNAKLASDGVLQACVKGIDDNVICIQNCGKCRKDYWLEEVE